MPSSTIRGVLETMIGSVHQRILGGILRSTL